MNTHSSRSHVMVRLSIESRKVSRRSFQPLRLSWGTDRPTCISTLNLVDLAGSERSSKSGTSGQSLKEGNFINKSLLTLGTVIANLSEGVGPNQHIPYRNSKLTRLLSTALGGNAKTCMISCISPAASNLMESLSTLRFASRAKKIVNVVHKNDLSNSKVLSAKLAQQAAEIEQLRMLLGSSQHGGGNDKEDADVQQKDQTKKAIRCLRFMVRNSSRILRGLRRYGNHSLISKVVGDLHLAVLERHDTDLESLMAELASIITTNLNSDHILQQRLRDLLERLYNDESGEDSLAMDPNDWPEGAAMDEEGYRRQIEMGLLGFEDFRVKAINRTNKLERMVMDFVAKEQKHRGQMQEMRAYTAALEMDLHLKEKRQVMTLFNFFGSCLYSLALRLAIQRIANNATERAAEGSITCRRTIKYSKERPSSSYCGTAREILIAGNGVQMAGCGVGEGQGDHRVALAAAAVRSGQSAEF